MFETLIVQPILNLLLTIYKGLSLIGLPYAFGFAIIALTVLVRLVFQPLFKQQIETQRKMAELKPKLDALSAKHKDDKTRLQQAQMDLYKEHGINPAGGCLGAIIQIPIFIGLYQTLNHFVLATSDKAELTKINSMLYSPSLKLSQIDPSFFIFNLADSPAKHKIFEVSLQSGVKFFGENLAYLPYLAIPIVTGLLQYLQAKTTMPTPAPKAAPTDSTDKDAKPKPAQSDDFQSMMNTQMKYMLPVMIGYFSYTLPLGLSLYWNIFSIFSILQGRKKAATQTRTIAKS